MKTGKGLKWIIVLLVGAAIFLISKCTNTPEPTEAATEELTWLNHNDSVDYVGIETCKQCHSAIYNTFIKTGMGSSFGAADTGKSIADISAHSVLFDSYHNLNYHPYWKKDSLHVREFRLSGTDTVFQKDVTVDYVVGSGQHTNSHLYGYHGYLFQVPFTWYAQKGKLDLPPGFENGNNTRFGRLIGLECTSCHNSMPTGFVAGSTNKYQKVPGAIDCERCHGPGELHVKRIQNGQFVDTATSTDFSIVNIKKLPIDLQFEACQRCHLQGNSVLAEGKTFFDFKPGMKLNAVMDIYLPRYSNAEDEFIMASHVDRFKQSECYLNSKGFNCVSCHNPHISVRFTDSRQFNQNCYSCHQGAPTHECTEKEAKLSAADFNCVSCHMPPSSSTDIPHVTVHDHKIKVPGRVKDTSGIKRFLGLVAVNNDSPTIRSKAVAYLQQYERFEAKAYYLDSAGYFLNKLGNPARHRNLWVQYYFLRNDYQALTGFVEADKNFNSALTKTSYDNSDAWAAYRIGEAYSAQGSGKALYFYKKAVGLAPFMPDFLNKYATELLKAGKTKEAISVFKKLLEELPNHKEGLNNLGYVYLQQGKTQLASLYFKKALAEDPDYEKAWLNLATLHLQGKNYVQAEKALKEVLRINPANNKARQALMLLK